MRYFCGWDGGGSKTEVLCADENGREIARKTFGSLNVNGAPHETVAETIKNAVAFMQSTADIQALVIGAPGISNAGSTEFITEEVCRCGYSGRLQIIGDHEIALEGAISCSGAVLIAGTGSICLGKNSSGRRARAGGFGHIIDDCGSGYAIGRDILSAVVRAHDGRGPKTCLTEMVLSQLGAADIRAMITWLYNPQTEKKDVAALSPLLNRALAENDSVAHEIILASAKELAQLSKAVWKQLDLQQGELALTGSIFQHFPAIREKVCGEIQSIHPGIRVISLENHACEGAVKLAMKLQPL